MLHCNTSWVPGLLKEAQTPPLGALDPSPVQLLQTLDKVTRHILLLMESCQSLSSIYQIRLEIN